MDTEKCRSNNISNVTSKLFDQAHVDTTNITEEVKIFTMLLPTHNILTSKIQTHEQGQDVKSYS